MKIRSLRQITRDQNHNAFTGACWFQDALYVAFRQGDSHVDPNGKLVVMRSRDEGISFDTVAVIRGEFDTRDAHLHTDGSRLFLNGFEADAKLLGSEELEIFPGAAWTDNGLNWSPWTRAKGAKDYVLWRPEYSRLKSSGLEYSRSEPAVGKHFCAGYTFNRDGKTQKNWGRVSWFQSDDGVHWELLRVLREGHDAPSECALDFDANGNAAILMRRDNAGHKPLLLRAAPPFEEWREIELDVALSAPALWFVGDDLWIAGRWFPSSHAAHLAVFRVVENKPDLQMVLPSGPEFDCSYMGIARHPKNRRRFFLSYYSAHNAPENPAVSQWERPDIYLADVAFKASFIRSWKVSALIENVLLADARRPDADAIAGWTQTIETPGEENALNGFADASSQIAKRDGIIYFVADTEAGPTDNGMLHLGYDGPIKVWLNGEEVFEAKGTNPALPDESSVAVQFRHGVNQLVIALDTNGGRAEGIFARYEKS